MLKGFPDHGSSFYDYLASHYPHLLPSSASDSSPGEGEGKSSPPFPFSHGTTVLAMKYKEGAIVAGDRMATEGHLVSARRIEKVFKADEHSAIAIAGVAGPCLEMAKLFRTELEHYEKLEGIELSTEGKANKLAQMIKGNLPMAMQGLVVIPIFAGYDPTRREGRIFKYDVTGGQYEEAEYFATGSGGRDARNTIKKFYKKDMEKEHAIRLCLEALYDASEEDVATAGPDFIRGIYPTVKTVTDKGIHDVEESKIGSLYEKLMTEKKGG